MEQLLKIINFIRDNKGLKPFNSISPEQNLMNDLEFDSLDLAELTVRCEKEFGVDIFEDGIVTNIREVLDKLNV